MAAHLPHPDGGRGGGVGAAGAAAGPGGGGAARTPARPAGGRGVVTVVRGARHSPRPAGGLAWRDIEGDGRYLVWGDTAVAVEPGTSWDLLDAVTRLTGRIAAGHPV
ncbi:hypothetical protein MLGJGCBP_01486 [Rhodococcus sp. T7]|nr:hypothetical protein MLGJGCBP_01486 [Rhodococcus sp. T7]